MPVIIFLFCCDQNAQGQTQTLAVNNAFSGKRNFIKSKVDSMEEAIDKMSQVRFQAGYQNKVLFAGRNFGLNQYGATMASTYHHRSGVNLEYEGNYWSKETPNPYALTEAGIYYEKALFENFYITPGYWRLFFHNGSEEERNRFTNFFLLDQSWYSAFGLFDLTYYFFKGNDTAHRLDINFTKSIDFYNKLGADKISLEPSVTATFSTVNYFVFLSGADEAMVDNPNAFGVGNYEFMLPVVYHQLGKFEFNVAWHYALPVKVSPNENLSPVSYFSVALIRTFMLKKTNLK